MPTNKKIKLSCITIIFIVYLSGVMELASAADLFKFENYKVKQYAGNERRICTLDDNVLIYRLKPQAIIPKGKDRQWVNFSVIKPTKVIAKDDGSKQVTSTARYFKKFEDLGLKYDIRCVETARYLPNGTIYVKYTFFNDGDNVFIDNVVNCDIIFKIIEGRTGIAILSDGKKKEKKFRTLPPGIFFGLNTYRKAPEKLKEVEINTKYDVSVKYKFSDNISAYVSRNGRMHIFYTNCFSYPGTGNYSWKNFQAGKSFVVKFIIYLPVVKKESKLK